MYTFAMFVNGSNLFGTFKHLEVFVDDYAALYRYIFARATDAWRSTLAGAVVPAVRHLRTYWYVVDSMDEWDLSNPRSRQHLQERFLDDREVRERWMAEAERVAGATRPDRARLEHMAFIMCFDDLKQWYEKKQQLLGGMNRFYHAVEASSDFIEMRRYGRWKLDLLRKHITEKGLDVGYAVDLMAFQAHYDAAVLIAADPDGLPGLEHVKSAGKQILLAELVRGAGDGRGRTAATRLKLAADCVVPIYEQELVKLGLASRGAAESDEYVPRGLEE